MKNILNIGEPMGLFVANEVGDASEIENFTRYSAGAEMNVAIGVSRLGLNSFYASAIGNDPMGRYIEKVLQREKVHTNYLLVSETELTGFMLKEKTLQGDPKVYYYRKGSAASKLSVDDIKEMDITKFDHIHFSGVYLAVSEQSREVSYYLAKKAKEHKIFTTFDPNLRPRLWKSEKDMIDTTNDFAKFASLVLPGISEGKILMGSEDPEKIADFYINNGANCVIIKLGAEGAYFKEKSGPSQIVKGFKVENIVDTVGAGDGFAVGIIYGLVNNFDMVKTVQCGNAIGAIQLGSASDNEGLPTVKELQNFMDKGLV